MNAPKITVPIKYQQIKTWQAHRAQDSDLLSLHNDYWIMNNIWLQHLKCTLSITISTWHTWMDVRIEETSYVGLHRFWSMSKHILPSAYTNIRQNTIISFQHVQQLQQNTWISRIPFGWNILEIKRTVGGLLGYSSENSITSLNVPAEGKNKSNFIVKIF